MLEPTVNASQLLAALSALIAKHGDLPVYARDPDTDQRLPIGLVFAAPDVVEEWPQRLEVTTSYHGLPPGTLAPADL